MAITSLRFQPARSIHPRVLLASWPSKPRWSTSFLQNSQSLGCSRSHQVAAPAPNPVYWQTPTPVHWPNPFPEYSYTYQQQFLKFLSCLLDPLRIGRIYDIDQGIGVREVIPPILSQRLLSSDVPHVEFEPIMGKVLDIEALSGCDG